MLVTARKPGVAAAADAGTAWPSAATADTISMSQDPRRAEGSLSGFAAFAGVMAHDHSEVCADQRAVHDWLNPAAFMAAMDGSLAADFCSASISRRYAAAPCRAARSRAASSRLANAM